MDIVRLEERPTGRALGRHPGRGDKRKHPSAACRCSATSSRGDLAARRRTKTIGAKVGCGADWTVAAARARRPLRDPTGDSRRSRRQRARRAVRRASDGWCCTNTRSSASLVCSVIYRPPGPAACHDQFAGDRPGLVRGQEDRDERDLRSVHHAADGITSRRVRSEVLPLRLFGGIRPAGRRGQRAGL